MDFKFPHPELFSNISLPKHNDFKNTHHDQNNLVNGHQKQIWTVIFAILITSIVILFCLYCCLKNQRWKNSIHGCKFLFKVSPENKAEKPLQENNSKV